MTNHQALVDELRDKAKGFGGIFDSTHARAADAIETLTYENGVLAFGNSQGRVVIAERGAALAKLAAIHAALGHDALDSPRSMPRGQARPALRAAW